MENEYCLICMQPLEGGRCPCGCVEETDPAPHVLPPGSLLNERYLIGRTLGEGGFGITYLGRDLTLDIRVAIKEFFPNGLVSRGTGSPHIHVTQGIKAESFAHEKEKFLSEARTLAKLIGERGVVDVRDFFEANGSGYLVMEYLDGRTLKDILRTEGAMPSERVFELMRPLMLSLDKVHAAGLIHRDISPDNIMLLPDGSIKLLDFGTARGINLSGQKSLSVMLKPGYAPEEQYRSKGIQGPWTDIYGLCATMYKCITGITPEDSLQRIFGDTVSLPSELGISILPHQEAALMKGMACAQEHRWQSVGELYTALYSGTQSASTRENGEWNRTVLIRNEDYVEDRKTERDSDSLHTRSKTTNIADERTEWTIIDPKPEAERGQRETVEAKPADEVEERPALKDKSSTAQEKKQDGASASKADKGSVAKKRGADPAGKKKKRFVILAAAAVLVLALAGLAVWRLSNTVTIAGETYEKNGWTSYITLDGAASAKDIAAIGKLNEVTSVSFSNLALDGEQLSALSGLTGIEELSFRKVTFLSSLDLLAAMPVLDSLSFRENDMPDISVDFPMLKTLNLTNVKNVDSLDFLVRFPGLTSLSYSNSFYSAEMTVLDFSPIGELTELRRLTLEDSGLTDLSFAASLTELTELNASYSPGNEEEIPATSITSLAPLAGCTKLSTLILSWNQVESLAGLENCNALTDVSLSNNRLTSVAELAGCTELKSLDLSNNAVTSLEGLEDSTLLTELDVSFNRISDLTPLSGTTELKSFQAEDNLISDLTPLAGNTDMNTLSVNGNSLTSLAGCEQMFALKRLQADDNAITSLDGIINSTVLEAVSLCNNQLSDISVLGKCDTFLYVLEAAGNNISSLDALSGCTELVVLNCGDNSIDDISAVGKMVGLVGLRLSGNNISTISALRSLTKLAYLDLGGNDISAISVLSELTGLSYIDLSSNRISNVSPLSAIKGTYSINGSTANINSITLYLEHNLITDLSELPKEPEYQALSVYDNPITDFSELSERTYHYGVPIYFSYHEKLDAGSLALSKVYPYYYGVVPIDRQAQYTELIKSGNYSVNISYYTSAEMDELLAEDKVKSLDDLIGW